MLKWDDEKDPLWLITPEEFELLPDGLELECISGHKMIKGKDYFDDDTRFGCLAYGIRESFKQANTEMFVELTLKKKYDYS